MSENTNSMLTRQILQNINLCSTIHKQHKTNILNKLINKNVDLAPQGSDEWLAVRKYTIGGSEMSIITGDNPYSKLDNLVAQKVGFSKFNGNIACRWGKIFEVVTQRLTERILNIDHIYETGSLEGAVKNQRYSPDGLGVVKLQCESYFEDEKIETEEYCIVLFEYKSPYSSIPMGIIPKYYLPQVKTGLCSISIADFAIFINNLFRKCSMIDLNQSLDYDIDFHSRDKKFVPEIVLAFGVNIFYQTPDQITKFMEIYGSTESKFNNTSSDTDETSLSDATDCDSHNIFSKINSPIYNNVNRQTPAIYKYIENIIQCNMKLSPIISGKKISVRDFGKSYYQDFNNLLELYDNGYISVHYCEPHICESYYDNEFLATQNKKPSVLDKLETSIENYKKEIDIYPNILGYMPWKLFKSDIIYEERDPTYLNKYADEITKTLNIVKDIKKSKTEFEKIKKFKQYFPKSKVLKENGFTKSDAFEFLPKNI
jgi:hypothetical protein